MSTREAGKSRWSAILRRRCPRCLEGKIYSRPLRPRGACSQCGLVFEREPGYFLGSFYISYGLGAVVAMPAILFVWLLGLPFWWLVPLAGGLVALFSPLIVTYARTLWYHMDQVVDPR